MKLKSVFWMNEEIPDKYTCNGDNVSPPLEFIDVPADAESLVLIVEDPDASSGTWVHWLVWNIPPDIIKFDEGAIPKGAVQGMNNFGKMSYGGPCPPSGTHRYYFKLYALNSKLNLEEGSSKADLEQAIENHILIQTELIGLYSKK